MQLIQIANKRKKTVINSSYENFVCKPRKKVQIKRLKNVSLEAMPPFGDSGTGRVGYMGVIPWSLDDKKSVLATTVFHPEVFPTPPLVAVTIPHGYHFKAYMQVRNESGVMRFIHYLRIWRNDDKDITVDEIYKGIQLYIYDFLTPQGQINGYGRIQEGMLSVHDGVWKLGYKVFVNEGMYRGDANRHVELPWQVLRKPRPNLTALKEYPDVDKCKCGVQVYGYHRFWNERFHSPKADKRSEEVKKAKGKLERYSADLLYDSRLPWLVVLDQVKNTVAYSKDTYVQGDIRLSHQDSKPYHVKAAVIENSVIEGIACTNEVKFSGLRQYEVRQGVTFTSDEAIGTVERDKELPTTAYRPTPFIGTPSLDYLVVNVDGVQPNTVDEFE